MADGECFLCGGIYSKRGMSRHLRSCQEENFEAKEKGKTIHLRVVASRHPNYWMHLGVKPETTLEELDQFLRDVWLECCGHLSSFEIRGQRFSAQPMEDYGDMDMGVTLGEVLKLASDFNYEYDFGTPTELSLKAASLWNGQAKEPILILAKNNAPSIECSCGNLATQVCTIHVHSKEGWLCDDCAPGHECDYALSPVVNSPRVGVCGYVGSSKATERTPSGGLKLVSKRPRKWSF